MCTEYKDSGNVTDVVPDFSAVGFDSANHSKSAGIAEAHAKVKDLKALRLEVCVGASYNAATNKICFSVPIYGEACITSPVSIPGSAEIKACVKTCGSIIPTGLKGTVYLNGNPIWSGTLFGSC